MNILNELENIPKESDFFIQVGISNEIPEDKLEKHKHVIMATLSNNKLIKQSINFDQKWVFTLEVYDDTFKSGYFSKRITLIKSDILENYTDLRTRIDGKAKSQLVCVLPMILNHDESGVPFLQLCKIIDLSSALSLKKIPNFLGYDKLINRMKNEVDEFWRDHQPDSRFLTQEFMKRRFKNEDFMNTTSKETIEKIRMPATDDTYNFVEMAEYKSNLKEAMGIQPLPLEDYEKYITKDGVTHLFSEASNFDNGNEIIIDLLEIMLKSYHLCHLVFHNPLIMKKMKILYTINHNHERIDKSLIWGLYTLYTEELVLGAALTVEHRSVFDIKNANLLPDDDCYNLYQSPYLCLPYDQNAIALHTNLIGLNRRDSRVGWFNFGRGLSQNERQFLSKGLAKRGINRLSRVRANVLDYTFEMLDELDDPEIFLTGSGAEACLYDSPLFRRNTFKFEDIYHDRESATSKIGHSDIDLVIFTEDQSVLANKAKKVADCVAFNINDKVIVNKISDYKFRITSEKMRREIDIFMTSKKPPALLYNYHISTCRAAISMDRNNDTSYLMTSMVISSNLGFCIDRRWFSSNTSLYDRISKQLSRGIGVMLNVYELQMMQQFFQHSIPWQYMRKMIEVNRSTTTDKIKYIKVYSSNLSEGFFLAPKKKSIGPKYDVEKADRGDPDDILTYKDVGRYNAKNSSFLRNEDGSFVI